jgi:protein kinase A
LKPENILIDADGYGIIVDLGFAKVVVDKTYTLCGTPEYLAPEIIMSRGHGKEVDCWSFGVLVYEMIVGVSPFYYQGMVQTKLFKRIVNATYNPPDGMDESAKDLVAKLLVCAPASRLGNLSGGWNDVKSHTWFQDMDFKKIAKKEVSAPYIPNIKDPLDSSNFEDFQGAENGSNKSKEKLSKEDQALFKDF